MTRALNVTVTPSASLLKDICITAMEGGIGYWATATQYQWRETLEEAATRLGFNKQQMKLATYRKIVEREDRQDLPFPIVRIEPTSDSDDFPDSDGIGEGGVTLTPEHILRGLEKALTRESLLANGKAGPILEAIVMDDASNIDSDIADLIVQLGVLGEIVYG